MFLDHDHGLNPIPNAVPWYYLAAAFGVGAALFVHGMRSWAKRWEDDYGSPAWFDSAVEFVAIMFATGVGVLVGHLVWNWVLGGTVALVGGSGSSFILNLIRARLAGDKSPNSFSKTLFPLSMKPKGKEKP